MKATLTIREMRFTTLICLGVLLGCIGQLTGQVTARLRLDSAAMLLGDPNRLVVTLSPPVEEAIVGWEVLDTMKLFEPIGGASREVQGNQLIIAQPFSVYDSAGILFPALPVYLPGDTVYTNDVALLVDFPPLDSIFHDFRGLREEATQLSDYLHWFIALGALLLLVLGGFLFYRYSQREPEPELEVLVIPDPAHVVALRKLSSLGLGDGLEDKAFYSALDGILREYLEGRYEIPALERTSSEVTGLLADRDLPDASELSALLSQVDLVKFAKAELPFTQRQGAADRIRAFVELTKQVPLPTDTLEEQTAIKK